MQISDDIQLGPAITGYVNSNGPSKMTQGVGPLGRTYMWDIQPVAPAVAGFAAVQLLGSAGNLTLTAGTGVTAVTLPNGTIAYQVDHPRCVTLTVATTDQSGVNFTVYGFDRVGQPMTEVIAGPNNNTVTGKKAFYQVYRVAASAAIATNGVSVGISGTFGLPFRCTDAAYIGNVKWDATLAANAGTFVAADVTSPATSTTGDVRGTYLPAGNAANGTRRLVMFLGLPAIASGPTATRIGAMGVDQV